MRVSVSVCSSTVNGVEFGKRINNYYLGRSQARIPIKYCPAAPFNIKIYLGYCEFRHAQNEKCLSSALLFCYIIIIINFYFNRKVESNWL